MLTFVVDLITFLGFGITLWQYGVANRKHKREIVSLKQENTDAIEAWRARAFVFGSLALLFLVLALAASRKAA